MSTLATVGRYAIVLGITGFVCGFVGPLAFAPESNQGPMFGIFITGPGGALLGAVLGVVINVLAVSAATATRFPQVAATLVAAITLYFSIPAPHYYADAIEGEILQCTAPGDLRERAVRRLVEFAASHPPLRQPMVWCEAFDRALDQDRGVVLDLHLARYRRLYERHARWNRGTLEAGPWVATDDIMHYYAAYGGAECDNYAVGAGAQFSVTNRIGIWPPSGLAEMLNMNVASPLDARAATAVGLPPSR